MATAATETSFDAPFALLIALRRRSSSPTRLDRARPPARTPRVDAIDAGGEFVYLGRNLQEPVQLVGCVRSPRVRRVLALSDASCVINEDICVSGYDMQSWQKIRRPPVFKKETSERSAEAVLTDHTYNRRDRRSVLLEPPLGCCSPVSR